MNMPQKHSEFVGSINQPLVTHMLQYRQYLPLRNYLQASSKLPPRLDRLIQLGEAILQNNIDQVNQLADSLNLHYITKPTRLQQRAYFYLEYMQLQFSRKEYGDYFRALSPLLVDVLRLVIERNIMPQLNEFIVPIVKENDEGVGIYRGLQWKQSRVESSDNIINQTFHKYYGDRFNYDHYVSSSHLNKIIDDHTIDEEIRNLTIQIRHVEKLVRNIAAHEIVYIDEAFVKHRSGMTITDFKNCLEVLTNKAGLTNQKILEVFIDINQQIMQELDLEQLK